MVWTSGEPGTPEECAVLTSELQSGRVEVIEEGRWGPYHTIVKWTDAEDEPRYFLVELVEADGDATP